MKKDVECTFQILKQCFSILRYGSSIKACDQAWMTCCSLHNLLLINDTYDKNWSNSEENLFNNLNNETNNISSNISFPYHRLNRNLNDYAVNKKNDTSNINFDA